MIKKNKIRDWLLMILVVTVLTIVLFTITFFINGTVMIFLGMKYTSVWEMIKFFLVYTICSALIETFIIGIVLRGARIILEMEESIYNTVHFLLSVSLQIIMLDIINSFLKGIYMEAKTIILFAFVDYYMSEFIYRKIDGIDIRIGK